MNIFIDQQLNVSVLLSETGLTKNTLINQSSKEAIAVKEGSVAGSAGGEYTEGGYTEGGMPGDMPGGAKDPLLSSWPFVIGITILTLAISVGLGILLAKRKIKKGIELYED